MPWSGRPVELRLRVRRFRCRTPTCPRRTFAERFPGLAPSYARRTPGQRWLLEEVDIVVGSRPGAALAGRLGVPTGRSTLLHLLKALPPPEVPPPRVIGVDDWCRRKGKTYGTIIVDLERHRPIDLLPDRTAETL